MKIFFFFSKRLLLLLPLVALAASLHAGHSQQCFDTFTETRDVQRTYLGACVTSGGGTVSSSITRPPKPSDNSGGKAVEVVITYDDFRNHLAFGQDRITRSYDAVSPEVITMDAGTGDGPDQVWNMPDLAAFTGLVTTNSMSMEVTNSPLYEEFNSEDVETGEITYPYAAYQLGDGTFQYFDLVVDEFEGEQFGTLDNRGFVRNDMAYPIVKPETPVPLSLNSFSTTFELEDDICALYEGGCGTGNPDESTFDLNSEFEIVASGILNTYDGESSPAIQVQLTETYTIKDNDNNVIQTRSLRWLLWYSKAGHYLQAMLRDGETFTGTTNFGYIQYQKLAPSTSLPVEWLDINAEVIKNSEVKLNWSTANETDNERFIVQRSANGERFTAVGWLDAQGDSQDRQDYTFTDEEPGEGFNYYRVRQQDLNGMDTYSSIVSALITRTSANEELVVLYPNPGRNEVFFSRPADYELMTIDGKVLAQGRVEQQLNVGDLPAGTYLVRIDGGKTHSWVKR